ncbi:MAG: hypothetical protein SV375_17310 [Thermodesulfobacteriota bacterium]|nr:hypothetical protein [Thermodesulfobacteriota bacterium]
MKARVEEDVAKHVVEWLDTQGWEVYQEVQIATYGVVADIIAVQKPLLWIIECKTSLSIAVMEQAYRWKGYANFVSVAVPKSNNRRGRAFAETILKNFGIGLLNVRGNDVHENISPLLNRKPSKKRILAILHDEQKTYAAAGNANNKRWTPYQQTCINILQEVNKQPGITMKELMERIKHHYQTNATARSCLYRWAGMGIIKGVCVKRDGRLIRFYPISPDEG